MTPALLAQEAGVRHHLEFPELAQQYVHVQSEFPTAGGTLELWLPAWVPGSYSFRNFSASLELLDATDEQGRALAYRKSGRSSWQVESGTARSVRVSYRVHTPELGVANSWVSPQFVLINGSSVFLYSEASRDLPQTLSLTVPAGLGQVSTPLAAGSAPDTVAAAVSPAFRAASYDELVDSPVLLAAAAALPFEADGHGYRLLNVAADPAADDWWDAPRAAADLKRLVQSVNAFWGEVPLSRDYWFINLLSGGVGGLEHDHATIMLADRLQMRQRDSYLNWLSLASHEYFHAWNIRRLRPAELARYDYQQGADSASLWLVEGLTSYYDDLLVARADLMRPPEYLARLAANVHALELTPGRQQMSLRQAARDTWLRHFPRAANEINAMVSYYTKGAVLGFVLDARIRAATRDRESLDSVMQRWWQDWRNKPYPEGAFLQILAEVAGQEVRTWLERELDSTDELDLQPALDWFGLALDRHPLQTALVSAGEPAPAGFGINWSVNEASLIVGEVVHGYAAANAGVQPGDELLAINSERVTRDNLEDLKQRLRPGEVVEFLLVRQGRVLRLPVTLSVARPLGYELKLRAGFTGGEERRIERWLDESLKLR